MIRGLLERNTQPSAAQTKTVVKVQSFSRNAVTGPGLNFRIEQRRVNSSGRTDAVAAAGSNLTVCDGESHLAAGADVQGLEIQDQNI